MCIQIRPSTQRGQGMVGFIVASVFVVIPLTLGINYIARLGDTKHKSIEAARYAVWERTVWHQSDNTYNVKSNLAISREINQRIFSKQTQRIDSREDEKQVAQDQINYDPNLYGWDRAGGNRVSIIRLPDQDNAEPNTLTLSDRRTPGNFSGAISRVASTMLDLNLNGFYNASVELEFLKDANFQSQFDNALGEDNPLITRSNNAMLIGAWNANGPANVRDRVRRLIPTTLLDNGVVDIFRSVASTAGFEEFSELEFGKVDPERVPCQRLTARSGGGKGC